MKKYKVGYTTGVFDMFHVGHLNILKQAKSKCDYLIVGVTTDKLAEYKNKKPIVPYNERIKIIKSIKYVDKVVPQETMNKYDAWNSHKFDAIFVGDDWKGTDKWKKIEHDLNKVGVDVVYFKYTRGTSSTLLREKLINKV